MACGPLSFICHAAGSAVGHVASSGFDAIAKSFANAAKTMCTWMWTTISDTTTVRLGGQWFRTDLKLTATIAAVMVAGLFVLQVIKGGLTRDPSALGRAVTGCATAFLGAAAAVATTQTLLIVTDRLCDGVVHTAGQGDLGTLGRKLTPVALLSGNYGAALVIILSILFVMASVLVWGVFLVRKAMIIVAAVFAPVAFGGASSDRTRPWVGKWIEFTVAMIFSKLAIVVIFVVALSLLGDPGSGIAGLSNLLTGLLLLLLASFAPIMVLKLVHYIGGDIAAAHHSSVKSDVRAAVRTASAPARLLKGSAPGVLGSVTAEGWPAATAAPAAGAPTSTVTALLQRPPNAGSRPTQTGAGGRSAPNALDHAAIEGPAE
jgi:type IV secretion system protein TrbL